MQRIANARGRGEHSSCAHAVRTVGKQNLPPFFAEMTVGKQNRPPVFTEMSVGKQNLPPFFAKIGVGKQNLPPVSSKNGKNYVFRGRNHQKSLKTANSVGRIIKKRRKLRIPWAESSKNGKNRLSPPWGKSKSPVFCVSPPWGKSKSPIFCVSPPLEKQTCPENRSSSADETQNHPFSAHRSQAKRKIARFLRVDSRRNAKSPVFCSSLASETQNHPFSARRS